MNRPAIADIHAMVANGRDEQARHAMAALVASGSADAMFETALWHLIGRPLPRDLPRARALLGEARSRGHADAAMFEIALCANGSGAPTDWATAYRLLEQAARHHGGDAVAQQAMLSSLSLTNDGLPTSPPTAEPLTADGSVSRFVGFASADECAHVAQAVGDILQPALVVDPRTGQEVPHPVRTSDAAVIGPTREDLVVRALNLRIAAATGTDVAQGEALTVLRYRPGQQFRLHSDAIAGARNQRVRTLLLYLNDGFTGGETTFPSHGLTVTARGGDALLFENVDASGAPRADMRHAGQPVTAGTKWLATRWIRARPFSPWTGPEA